MSLLIWDKSLASLGAIIFVISCDKATRALILVTLSNISCEYWYSLSAYSANPDIDLEADLSTSVVAESLL